MAGKAHRATPRRGRPRTGERIDSLHDVLIGAGLKLLRTESLEALSLRKVAAAAGVSHAAAYRYFEDKNALFAAMAEEGFRLFYDSHLEALAAGPDSWDAPVADDFEWRIRCLGWTYVEFTLENPGYARMMFGAVGFDFRSYPDLVAASARTFRLLLDTIRRGQRTGAVGGGRLKEKSLAAWAMVHGMAMLLLDGRVDAGQRATPEKTRQLVVGVIEHVFTGMLPTATTTVSVDV